MMIDGTWDTQKFTSALGTKVAAFVPPFSNTPIKGVVDFAGDGLSMTTYAKHPTQALQFLTFMTTPQAAKIINAAGLIPAIKGTSTSNPVNQQMLNFVSQDHLTAYPMLDNVVQPERGHHRQQGPALGAQRHHVTQRGAAEHADHAGPAAGRPARHELPVVVRPAPALTMGGPGGRQENGQVTATEAAR